jgi:hypothetical protein
MLTRTLFLLSVPLALGACGFFKQLAGANTVDLQKAEVKKMGVDIRKPQKTICPREDVQMAVFADVVLDGDKEAKSFETWQGRGSVNKNDKIEFTEFAFHSEQGTVAEDGWFHPNPSVLSTVSKEYAIKTVYKRRPDKFSFTTTYKPDYGCISGAGKDGASGGTGQSGRSGESGGQGQSGSATSPGGPGRDGGNGGPGGNGTDGGGGARIVVAATMVKTSFYERLVAIRIGGDLEDFLLVPEGKPIVVRAAGGQGGSGGHGGGGGSGGRGGSGNPGGQGGNGGAGGNGGNGGNGGQGGTIDFMYDARFPDIARLVRLDVSGGGGGGAGGGGGGGSAGGGGFTQGQNAQMGKDGAKGPEGSAGAAGQRGADGQANARTADVRAKFDGLAGVTVL